MESVLKIRVGSLVRQAHVGHEKQRQVREDRAGLSGVIVNMYETKNPLAAWSPMTADVMWSDGMLTEGWLVAALELIQY